MFTCRSLLLSAACILIFSRITLADSAGSLISCNEPHNFTVKISNNERAYLYEPELSIHVYENELSVVSNPGTNSVKVSANNVYVRFTGDLVIEDVEQGVLTGPNRIHVTDHTDTISGIAQRIFRNSTDNSMVHHCRLVLLATEHERLLNLWEVRHKSAIANGIRRYAESCLELALCEKIGHMKPEDVIPSPSQSGSGLLLDHADPFVSTAPPARNNDPETSEVQLSHEGIQPVINKLVDVALAEITKKLGEMNEGTFDVSDMNKTFTIGSGIFETTGYLEAMNGKLRDLTTIRRITDATLSQDGLKFVASCGFGLTVLNLNYDRYTLQYGYIYTEGELTANIDGLALEFRVAVDYTQTPCHMQLEHLEVTEIGEIDIDMTSTSGFSWVISKVVSFVTQFLSDEIMIMIEEKLRTKVNAILATTDCEMFRP